MKDRAVTVVKELLSRMDIVADVEVKEDDEQITIDIKGPETGLIIGKKGQSLDALQYIVNKILFKGQGEGEYKGKPLQLDAEGYRERRAQTLRELGLRLAEKAQQTGQAVELDPMTAADRRIVHMALANVSGIRTESEGEGIYRHLVIHPQD
jgi:spoIIIJ-associated protein